MQSLKLLACTASEEMPYYTFFFKLVVLCVCFVCFCTDLYHHGSVLETCSSCQILNHTNNLFPLKIWTKFGSTFCPIPASHYGTDILYQCTRNSMLITGRRSSYSNTHIQAHSHTLSSGIKQCQMSNLPFRSFQDYHNYFIP